SSSWLRPRRRLGSTRCWPNTVRSKERRSWIHEGSQDGAVGLWWRAVQSLPTARGLVRPLRGLPCRRPGPAPLRRVRIARDAFGYLPVHPAPGSDLRGRTGLLLRGARQDAASERHCAGPCDPEADRHGRPDGCWEERICFVKDLLISHWECKDKEACDQRYQSNCVEAK